MESSEDYVYRKIQESRKRIYKENLVNNKYKTSLSPLTLHQAEEGNTDDSISAKNVRLMWTG